MCYECEKELAASEQQTLRKVKHMIDEAKKAEESKKILCSDQACSLIWFGQHEFGKGCRLF